jgi:hypothetical protein
LTAVEKTAERYSGARELVSGLTGGRRRLLQDSGSSDPLFMFAAIFESMRERKIVEEMVKISPNASKATPSGFLSPKRIALSVQMATLYVKIHATNSTKPSDDALQSLSSGTIQAQLLQRASLRASLENSLISAENVMQSKVVSIQSIVPSNLDAIEASLKSLCMSVTLRALDSLFRMIRQVLVFVVA